jgi:hypothetical protein
MDMLIGAVGETHPYKAVMQKFRLTSADNFHFHHDHNSDQIQVTTPDGTRYEFSKSDLFRHDFVKSNYVQQ